MPPKGEALSVHLYAYNPNPRVLTWERLEYMRLQKLGLANRYSRHCNVTRTSDNMRVPTPNAAEREKRAVLSKPRASKKGGKVTLSLQASNMNNSVAPFATMEKPTCGFFFSDLTDNKKKNFGIPPSDLVKWRTAGIAN